ncbi:SusF/SusE family outer membrane protein [Chryseobacterium indologenes]|uniref:SusF/SusE family outer membrane protein n=1 Tax=Chryseobacterium indologenes TaxID=253 RepID=UPI0009EB9762|nr:SusF/SusE family outer membrane protein [Chryseobacterium indologenes]
MKNIFKIIFSSLLLAIVVSCEDDDKITLNETSAATLAVDKNTVVLDNTTPLAEALKFTYTFPSYNPAVVPSYFVELGIKGNNFAKTEVLVAPSDAASVSITHKALNDLLLSLGAKPGEATSVEARFKTAFSEQTNYYSNVLNLTITPFVSMKNLYLVGGATESGWENNANNLPVFRDPANVNKFYYTGYFKADGFKLLEQLGAWHPQWGLTAGNVMVSNLDGSNEPGAFTAPSAGYYTFTIDINAKTYSLTPYTVSSAPYPTIGIIGSSTSGGWDADQDMTASALNPHIWKVTNIPLTAGEAKFRANNSWDVNWGGSTPFSGIASAGGGNIPVNESGNYDVFFNDLDGRYLFIKK